MLPDIDSKKYLELGIYDGLNFGSIRCKNKVSVDAKFKADFNGTTDVFFKSLNSDDKFDIIYIDACHQWDYVVRDFNNSLKHLSPGGLILVHDLIPDNEMLTAPHFCGDAYKILGHILKNQREDYKMYSQNSDYGLTIFVNPTKQIVVAPDMVNLSYLDFKELLHNHRLYSRDELQKILKKLELRPEEKEKPVKSRKKINVASKTRKSKGASKTKKGKVISNAKPEEKPEKKSSSNRRTRVHRKSPSKRTTKK
jgi:SAM-dependent methyltransferase